MTSSTEPLARVELDEHGNLRPFTADQCMEIFTRWANDYPSARFLAVALSSDGSDGEILGWGLALPDRVFADLPRISLKGTFQTAANLLGMLRISMDARLIWVDPEPEHWPADQED